MDRKTNFSLAAALFLVAASTTTTDAFWPTLWGQCHDRLEAGRQENAMWPYPYICPDRQRAKAPFETMVHNGWRRQNLLGDHHFDPETTKLTKAGELKVRWILTQTPPQHRKIYVERSFDPSVTDERIAAARAFGSNAAIDGTEPLVASTHLMSEGRPAGMVDLVQKSFQSSMRPVVLPTGSTSTSSE